MEAFLKTFDLEPIDVPMIVASALLFIVLWRALSKYFFTPYLNLIEAREKATTGAEKVSRETDEESTKLLAEYDSKLLDVRVAAMKIKLAKLAQAKEEAAKILDKAKFDSEELIKNSRRKIEDVRVEKRQRVFSDLDSMVDLILDKIRSDKGGTSSRSQR